MRRLLPVVTLLAVSVVIAPTARAQVDRRVVALAGESADGTTFANFTNAVINSNGQVAFLASDPSFAMSVWVADRDGTLHRRFSDHEPVGSDMIDAASYIPFLDGGGGLLATAGFNYVYASGTGISHIIGQGDRCPNGQMFSFAFDRHRYGDNARLLINDFVCGESIFFGGPLSSLGLIVAPNTSIPGFDGSTPPAVVTQTGLIAQDTAGTSWFTTTFNCSGIPVCPGFGTAFLHTNGTGVDTVFRFGDPAPGVMSTEVLNGARTIVASAAGAAFVGYLGVSPGSGAPDLDRVIYVSLNGTTPKLIARSGDAVPGMPAGAVFRTFEQGNVPQNATFDLFMGDNGAVVFSAIIDHGTAPIAFFRWTQRDGIKLLAADGPSPDPMLGRMDEISEFTMSPSGRVAFTARLPDQPELPRAVFLENAAGVLVTGLVARRPEMFSNRPNPITVDTISVLGMTLDAADKADRQIAYGAGGELVVSAGGSGTTRSSAVLVINPDGPKKEVRVVGIEVVQAVQNWDNSVPLVAGKPTFVRVHVEADQPTVVSTRLRARRQGAEIPFSPFEGSSFSRGTVAEIDSAPNRGLLGGAMYFELPPSWWNEGDLELEVEAHPDASDITLRCQDDALPAKNDCKATVRFDRVPRLEVKLLQMALITGGMEYSAPAATRQIVRDLLSIYPISSIDFTDALVVDVDPAATHGLSEAGWLRTAMLVRAHDGCLTCGRLYYGYAPLDFGDPGGISNHIPGDTAIGGYGDIGFFQYRHAHELGHLLGQAHRTDPRNSILPNGSRRGACREKARGTVPTWSYFYEPHGVRVATLGPLDSQEHIEYGFDLQRWKVIDPHDHYELMSYCHGFMNGHRWISGFMTDAVKTAITARFPSMQMGQSLKSYRILRVERKVMGGPVAIDRVFQISTIDLVENPPAGPLTLQLRDSTGSPLMSIPFEPTETSDDEREDGVESTPGELTTFAVPIEVAFDQIVVLDGSTELARSMGSPNPPVVTVTAPNGGENITADTMMISWTAHDPDGDDLTFDVSYTADGGTTWTLVAANVPENSVTVDRRMLRGGTAARVRVDVSDGLRTASDISDADFTVKGRAPLAIIQRPTDGILFTGSETLFLVGAASDAEDGTLPSSALSWLSDRDGPLASGSTAAVSASSLSEGDHVISLRATDRDGDVGEDSVHVRVARTRPAALFDLSSSAWADPNPLRPGDTTQLSFEVYNAGPDDAPSVALHLVVPTELGAVAPMPGQGTCMPEGTVRYVCALGALARAAHASIMLAAHPSIEGAFEASANIELASGDPISANNAASVRVLVSAAAEPPPDGGANDSDAAIDGGANGDAGAAKSSKGGCGCRAANDGAGSFSLFAVALLFARLVRRRRLRLTGVRED